MKSTGKITKNDLIKFYKETGNPKNSSDISEIFKNIDLQNKGYLEYEEFLIAAIPKDDVVNEKIIDKFFDYFDNDKNGCILLEEFKIVFNNFTEEEQQEIFRNIDTDGNGNVDKEEF